MDALTRRAERALLGAMIAAPWLMTWVRMRPEEFEDLRHRSTFQAILAARREFGRSRDTGEWRKAILLQAGPVVTPAALDDLVAGCPFPHHGIAYAGMVIQAWAARAVQETAETILARARLLHSDSRQIMRVAMAEGLEATTVARHMQDVAAAMHAHVSAIGHVPPSMDLVADYHSPEQAKREEMALAGLLVLPRDRMRKILQILDNQHIHDPYRRTVLHVVHGMHATGMAVDALTLDWELALRSLPLVRQTGQDKSGETYATRLALTGTDDERPIQAARELTARHEQSLTLQQASRQNGLTGQRRERRKRREPQAGTTGHPVFGCSRGHLRAVARSTAPSRGGDARMSAGEEHAPATSRPLAISHAQMNAAIDRDDATPLRQGHGWLTRYLDTWWIEYEGGWLRVIDDAAARELDQIAARLAEVSAITAADGAERLSIERERADGGDGSADGQDASMEPVRPQPPRGPRVPGGARDGGGRHPARRSKPG